MRENEAKVAGHSDYIFTTQYDLKAREVATILVSSLQERRDTIGPVLDLNLPKRDIEADIEARMDTLRAAIAKTANLKKERLGMFSKDIKLKILDALHTLDASVLEKRDTLSLKMWGKTFFQLMCQRSSDGGIFRKVLLESILSERKLVIKFISKKAQRKLIAKKVIKDQDASVLKQLSFWIYSLKSKKERGRKGSPPGVTDVTPGMA